MIGSRPRAPYDHCNESRGCAQSGCQNLVCKLKRAEYMREYRARRKATNHANGSR